MKNVSLIIAAYNEEQNLRRCVQNARKLGKDVEIIVVDGESQDGTYALARSLGTNVYRCAKGRGHQFNEGVRHASGDILVFLHADTQLPDDAFDQLKKAFSNKDVQIGTFRMRFEYRHWILALYAFFTRFDTILTSFGDQGIVVRKEFFEVLGGFPQWPLFEDVHFLRMARKRARILSFPARSSHQPGGSKREG